MMPALTSSPSSPCARYSKIFSRPYELRCGFSKLPSFENYLQVISCFITDLLPTHVQALDDARNGDLLFWASRYNLFVLWSADRQHPWDSHPEAEKVAATFEIGRLQGSTDEVSGLLALLRAWAQGLIQG